MKRLFCAVRVPAGPEIQKTSEVFHVELSGQSINWVDLNNLHITLKFLGETPLQLIDPIIECLHEVAADSPPFPIRLQGCGTFGNFRQPRVIWLGVRNADPLISLAHTVQRKLISLGYEPEKKVFSPHLTIGRIKQLQDRHILDNLERRFRNHLFSELHVGHFLLVESFLRPQGPLYKTIQSFELGEGHRA
jgi:RNA 2',3'-cyclic 3'-phosphodiesterase